MCEGSNGAKALAPEKICVRLVGCPASAKLGCHGRPRSGHPCQARAAISNKAVSNDPAAEPAIEPAQKKPTPMIEPPKISRRSVLAAAPAAALALASSHPAPADQPKRRPRVAAIATEMRPLSHGEVIIDRFLEGFGWAGEHHHPAVDLVALYVDQRPDSDLSRERASRFEQLKIYPTIAEALTQGGSKLAVDGVVLIGEHGSYPRNEKGQTLYPRWEFFQQTVDVFRASGRTAAGVQRQAPLVELGPCPARWSTSPTRCSFPSWPARACR